MKTSVIGKVFFLVTGLAIIMWLCGYNVFTKEMVSGFGRDIGKLFIIVTTVLGLLTIYWTFHPILAFLLMPIAGIVIIIWLVIWM